MFILRCHSFKVEYLLNRLVDFHNSFFFYFHIRPHFVWWGSRSKSRSFSTSLYLALKRFPPYNVCCRHHSRKRLPYLNSALQTKFNTTKINAVRRFWKFGIYTLNFLLLLTLIVISLYKEKLMFRDTFLNVFKDDRH